MSQELIDACKMNRFPSLSVLCDFGLDGRDGVNPIVLFDLYKDAILKNKISKDDLENALMTDTLETIVGIPVRSGWGLGQPSSV